MCLQGLGRRSALAQHLRDLAQLRRVGDRIDREYAQSVDVEALAYGESPYSYVMTRRSERATALLRRGDPSVTEVCFAVGY